MSAPTEPFAKGYGILVGIFVLWAATFGLLWIGKIIVGMLLGSGEEAI